MWDWAVPCTPMPPFLLWQLCGSNSCPLWSKSTLLHSLVSFQLCFGALQKYDTSFCSLPFYGQILLSLSLHGRQHRVVMCGMTSVCQPPRLKVSNLEGHVACGPFLLSVGFILLQLEINLLSSPESSRSVRCLSRNGAFYVLNSISRETCCTGLCVAWRSILKALVGTYSITCACAIPICKHHFRIPLRGSSSKQEKHKQSKCEPHNKLGVWMQLRAAVKCNGMPDPWQVF